MCDAHGSPAALDWVGEHAGGFDAAIVGGDLAKGGPAGYGLSFLLALTKGGRAAVYVPGNWDEPDAPLPDRVVNLHGRTMTLGRRVFGGLGGSGPAPFKSPFELTDDQARAALTSLGRVDVLVSHSPPARTKCDLADGVHIGSVPVREYVLKERPGLVLSGHVHESRAVDRLGGTTVVNPGPISRGRYAVVTLGSQIQAELLAWTPKG